jgi:hypothetical protein
MEQGVPVISVDTNKKELIGNYKQNGKIWCAKGKPTLVKGKMSVSTILFRY